MAHMNKNKTCPAHQIENTRNRKFLDRKPKNGVEIKQIVEVDEEARACQLLEIEWLLRQLETNCWTRGIL